MNTTTPATYYVYTDHLNRPVKMSDASKAIVWSVEYQPWGAVQSLSGGEHNIYETWSNILSLSRLSGGELATG